MSCQTFQNPMIWADVPDPDVIRVGETYYMTSTTMHMNPGVPIMKSRDLLHWHIVNYVYDILDSGDQQTLNRGSNEYGKGSWASSLRFYGGWYYVVFSSNSVGKTFVYKTRDVERGPWRRHTLPFVHDMSLLFDDDGRTFLAHGAGDIRLIELTADASGIKEGGLDQVIIPDASLVAGPDVGLPAEGAHLQKINGRYYVFLITWPRGGQRTQLVFRADNIEGPYEGRIALDDAGIAQGGIVDTTAGDWYALLFQDHGAVGRVPFLIPVTWDEGWPIFGEDGRVPSELSVALSADDGDKSKTSGWSPTRESAIVASDEFDQPASRLPLVWQWNHNPDNRHWSLTERPGYLRLTTSRLSSDLLDAPNTLTQRSFGPRCSGSVAMEIGKMKDGDVAGLAAFQKHYGFVGVRRSKSSQTIVMVQADGEAPLEVEAVPVSAERVYVKIDMDFEQRADKAYFYYSLDGDQWKRIGDTLHMKYTLPHFMGYRFALFHYATEGVGGQVDFDYFRIKGTIDAGKARSEASGL